MRSISAIVLVCMLAACVTQKPSVAENTQLKFLKGSTDLHAWGLNLDLALTYKRPLKAPFVFHADLRCRGEDGAFEVRSILTAKMGSNVLPGEATKVNFSWNGPGFDRGKESVCKVRFFTSEDTFLTPEDEEASYKFISTWCLKPIAVSSSGSLEFTMADDRLCQ